MGLGGKRGAGPVALAVLLVCILLSSGAVAAGGEREVAYEDILATTRTDSGYRVSFQAWRAGRDQGASVTVSDKRASASYALRDFDGYRRNRVDFDLGEFGSASFTLNTKKRNRRKFGPCSVLRNRIGFARGTLIFHGEGGYVEVDETKLRARAAKFIVRGCKKKRPAALAARTADMADVGQRRHRGRKGSVQLVACDPGTRTRLIADAVFPREDLTIISVNRRERTELLRIDRSAFLADPGEGYFSHNRRLTKAELDLPAPFSGQAKYADGELTGDLVVDLPGVETVSLTPLAAILERSRRWPRCR